MNVWAPAGKVTLATIQRKRKSISRARERRTIVWHDRKFEWGKWSKHTYTHTLTHVHTRNLCLEVKESTGLDLHIHIWTWCVSVHLGAVAFVCVRVHSLVGVCVRGCTLILFAPGMASNESVRG